MYIYIYIYFLKDNNRPVSVELGRLGVVPWGSNKILS